MNLMIQDMIGILTASFTHGDTVPLHALLWSIDAKHHTIPSADEINNALEQSPDSRIERGDEGIVLAPAISKNKDVVTEQDVEEAMTLYRDQGAGIIDKLSKGKEQPTSKSSGPRRSRGR